MSGIYIAAFASEDTRRRLNDLLLQAADSIPVLMPSELHVTLAHDAGSDLTPQELSTEADPLRVFIGKVACVEMWRTGNGNPILVASLLAPELHERWKYWQAWGLEWTFPTYRPHMSLTDGIKGVHPLTVAKWCRILNEALQGLEFTFQHEYVQSIRKDAFIDPKAEDERPEPVAPVPDEYEEETSAVGGTSKHKGRKAAAIGLPSVTHHRPKLSEEELRSMKMHGFNSHGIHDRIHDQRPEESEEE